ncbi:MAG: RND family transporter [Spirochaetales bacterium]|nr:RND family transporter [Spirochaetales bacterium]
MIRFFLRHRKAVLIIGVVSTVLLGANALFLKINGSFTTVLPKDDPDFIYNRYVEDTFGHSDEIILLLTDEKSIYSEDVIRAVKGITDDLSRLDLIASNSIFTFLTVSDFDFSALSDDKAANAELIAALKNFMETDPFSTGIVTSEDGFSCLIIAPVSSELTLDEENLKETVNAVYDITAKYEALYPGLSIEQSGHPVVNSEIMARITTDLLILFIVAILTVAIMLRLILGSFKAMLVPIVITAISVLWTFGLKGLLRSDLTITEAVIPVILISVACADGIHIVSEVFHYMHHGHSTDRSIRMTMHRLWKPVVLTSLTTATGFASFIFSRGESLRNMGLFLAFGVITAMFFSLIYIPVIMSWFKPVQMGEDNKHFARQLKLLHRVERIVEAIIRKRIIVLLGAVLVLGLSIWGMTNINTDTDEIRYFKKDNPVRISAEKIEREMGGISALQIILESEEENIFQELDVLQAMAEFQKILKARDDVSYSLSLADYVSNFYFRMRGRNPDMYQIPDNQLFLTRMFRMIDGTDDPRIESIKAFVDDDYRRAKITVRINNSNTSVMEKLLSEIQPELDRLFDDRFTIGYAGDFLRLSNGRIIVESQVLSLTVTLGVILIVLSVMYRSPLMGLIVSLPVIIAVLFNFAIMWLFHVSLNPATSIISAVGLGVGIDYSIHLYSRFRFLYKKSGRKEESIINAVVETSRGILSNALSVGLGFLILLLSAYSIINDMGWIVALSMLTTSLTSLVLLPVLLSFIIPSKS